MIGAPEGGAKKRINHTASGRLATINTLLLAAVRSGDLTVYGLSQNGYG